MSESVVPDAVGETAWTRPELLRQSREAAGLHIAALAAALKVPVKKLDALEAGRYEELPDMTFARALASSACRQLKIDPAPVLEQIPTGRTPMLGDSSHTINAPFRSPRGSSLSLQPSEWLRRPAVLVAGALVMAAVALMYMPDWRSTVDNVSGAVTRLSDTSVATTFENRTSTTEVVPLSPGAPVTSDAPVVLTPPSSVVTPSVDASVAAPPASVDSEGLLSIKANGDSWVEVVDGRGVSQVQRMLKTGDVLSFSASPPYSVVLGRADAVEVTVRGQAFDVVPYARNSVARFKVK
ncbi:helix-turn-helix domain-containing protein [Hydrogenophaga sp. SL48]|uniref:helix-turn-helix domain-containing protein n=1 Tax=Hydrogenophaga sp. SL48 TaxID=2806347 RepID=UPI001F3E4DC8|nr:helix-turn-helix domain-containing protein [Hydrogenophaga sp. SL48]UJW82873.1 helix-turn-helix domain-containing protein [Hydrogenophaga sp. SL48]